ncbi:hypothetical protein ABPG72_022305 [Tetrahymena utriculariae]
MIRAEQYQEKDRILSQSSTEQGIKRGTNFVLYQNIQEEGLIQQIIPLKQATLSLYFTYFLYVITLGFFYLILRWKFDWKIFLQYKEVQMEQADYVAIYGPGKILMKNQIYFIQSSKIDFDIQIEQLQIIMPQGRRLKMFMYRYYRYAFYEELNQIMPLSDQVSQFTNKQLIYQFEGGLNEGQVVETIKKNGLNQTDIPERSAFRIIIDEILSPFYIFQIFSISLWYFDEYRIYASVILFSSVISICLEVREAKRNIRKLKEISHQSGEFKVLRDNQIQVIDSRQIVFGDTVYLEEDHVAPCDLVIIEGSAIVNEAMLTGESIPVIKTHIENVDSLFIENKQSIIYAGSKLLSQNHLRTQAIRISFETLKGNLIRSIMYPKKHSQLSFYADSIKFILVLASIAFISFLISVPSFIVAYNNGYMEISEIVIRALDLITISVPPALPTALSFGISFALKRLSQTYIFCVNPQKINVCGKVKTVCFDKTGTLTEEGLTFKSVKVCNQAKFEEADIENLSQEQENQNSEIQKIITASCHSIMLLKGQMLGDPMDIEMFKQTNYSIQEAESNQKEQGLPVIAQITKQSSQRQIKIIKRFQFESECQMMSVLAIYNNEKFVLSKGSPEKIQSICEKHSIPANYEDILQQYTLKGYRVIGLSFKELKEIDLEKERSDFEQKQIFAGFLIFENKLKTVTTEHIQLLKSKSIIVIMITGDNALTATQVAKNCSIIKAETPIQILDYSITTKVTTLNNQQIQLKKESDLEPLLNQDLTITGNFFEKYMNPLNQETNLTLLMGILTHAKVYARMKPDQKQQLILLLQSQDPINYTFVAMCGDGANDCGALKDADMGVSLSDTEASIAASFTSKIQNISCIEKILREGRASLVTSFQCFKYMALYSLIQCTTTTILYVCNSIPSDMQFLYWDLFIILPLAFMLGLTKASDQLTHKTPTANLISHEVITSVVGQTSIQIIFQIIAVMVLKGQDWYIDSVDMYDKSEIESLKTVSQCYDSTTLFWVTNIQYIAVVISFSIGSVFKKPFYTNLCFTLFFIAILLLSILTIFWTQDDFKNFFDIKDSVEKKGKTISVMPYNWRIFIGIYCLANMAVTLLYEKYALPYLVNSMKSNLKKENHKKKDTPQNNNSPQLNEYPSEINPNQINAQNLNNSQQVAIQIGQQDMQI